LQRHGRLAGERIVRGGDRDDLVVEERGADEAAVPGGRPPMATSARCLSTLAKTRSRLSTLSATETSGCSTPKALMSGTMYSAAVVTAEMRSSRSAAPAASRELRRPWSSKPSTSDA